MTEIFHFKIYFRRDNYIQRMRLFTFIFIYNNLHLFVYLKVDRKSCAARQRVLLEVTQGHDRDNICQG